MSYEPKLFTAIVYYCGHCYATRKGKTTRSFKANRRLVIMALNEDAARIRAIAWFAERAKLETASIEFSPGMYNALLETLALDGAAAPAGVFVAEEPIVDVAPV